MSRQSGDNRPRLAILLPRAGIGSEVWTYRQAAAMRRFQPTFFAWSDAGETTPPDGIKLRFFCGDFPSPISPTRKFLRRLGSDLAYRLPLRQAAAIFSELASYDAILCHFAWTAIPVSQAVAGRRPLIVHVHGRDVSAQLSLRSYRRALTRVLPQADLLVAVGSHQVDRLNAFTTLRNTAVIPCGAPIGSLSACPTACHADASVTIVSVGRFSEEKGVMQTLEAFDRVSRERQTVRLVMIGDGPLLSAARARASASRWADRIEMPGRMASGEVAHALSRAQIFTQHSREVHGWVEGFGVTITEAGAMGLPLVVSATGGVLDQLDEGVNGLLFKPDDVEGQAVALGRLADSAEMRKRMGQAARRLALRFDTNIMVAALEERILETMLECGAVR